MQRKGKSKALKEKNLVVLCTTSPTNHELNPRLVLIINYQHGMMCMLYTTRDAEWA